MSFLPIVTTTAGILSSALSSVKSARDLAKNVTDHELKEQIGAAYETLLDLREHLLNLDEENRTLRAQLATKAAYVGPLPPHGFCYAADDLQHDHPLCPNCYQDGQKIGYMGGPMDWNGGIRRQCGLCKHFVYEKDMELFNHESRYF